MCHKARLHHGQGHISYHALLHVTIYFGLYHKEYFLYKGLVHAESGSMRFLRTEHQGSACHSSGNSGLRCIMVSLTVSENMIRRKAFHVKKSESLATQKCW